MEEKDFQEKLNCPMCNTELPVESVRYHLNDKKRKYWECSDCNVSIMHRGNRE